MLDTAKNHNTCYRSIEEFLQSPDARGLSFQQSLLSFYSSLLVGKEIISVEFGESGSDLIYLVMASGEKVLIEPVFVGDDKSYAGLCCVLQNDQGHPSYTESK